MKKMKLFIVLSVACLFLCSCGKNTIKEAYGSYECENADGTIANIEITKDEIIFDNVDMEALKAMKVAFEVKKEEQQLQRDGKLVDDKTREELNQKYSETIDWKTFTDMKFGYNAEYEKDSQAIYFESVTGNENELFFSYDLKYKTLTIYNTEFVKK